jgi:hypothetical protein
MTLRVRPLPGILVFLVVAASPLIAQTPIQYGDIVTISDNNGHQLSAALPQTLNLSASNDAWEQWQYSSGGLLTSFHGTTLIDDIGGLTHAPAKVMEPTLVTVQGVKWGGSQYGFSPLIDGGECALQWLNGSLPFWWVADNGRMLSYMGQMNYLPNGTAFHIHKVASPRPGRLPLKRPMIDALHYGIRAFDGSMLGALNAKASVRLDAVHAARGTLWWQVNVAHFTGANANGDRVLHVGDTLTVYLDFGGGQVSSLVRGGTKFDNQLESVAFVPGLTEGWTIVADGYAKGNRLPEGVPICLQAIGTTTNISSDPGRVQVQLSPNCSGWEKWTLTLD